MQIAITAIAVITGMMIATTAITVSMTAITVITDAMTATIAIAVTMGAMTAIAVIMSATVIFVIMSTIVAGTMRAIFRALSTGNTVPMRTVT
jgi:hypothetical protein